MGKPDAPPEVSDEVLRDFARMVNCRAPLPMVAKLARFALAQRAEIAGLREALRPFAIDLDPCGEGDDYPDDHVLALPPTFTVGQIRAVRALLARGGEVV